MIMDEIKNIPEFHFIIKGAGRVDEKTLKSASFDYSPDRLPVQSEPKRFTATVNPAKQYMTHPLPSAAKAIRRCCANSNV